MTDTDDTPDLDITQDGKLPDEPVEQAGETPAEEVEKEAPAETEEEAASQEEDSGDDATEDQGDEPKKAKPKVQKRIDELTKARHDAERKAQRLEAELDAARHNPSPVETTAPNPDKYELGVSDPDYLSDLTIHKMEKRQAEHRAATEKQSEEFRQQEAARTWSEKTGEAASRYDDYEAVAMNPKLPVSQPMADALQASDVGADVLYWLGQNPTEARRISTLPAVKQALEIGRIETLVESNEGVEPPPKKLTAAPQPAKRLVGKVTPSKDPTKMSNDEYRAYRAKKTA